MLSANFSRTSSAHKSLCFKCEIIYLLMNARGFCDCSRFQLATTKPNTQAFNTCLEMFTFVTFKTTSCIIAIALLPKDSVNIFFRQHSRQLRSKKRVVMFDTLPLIQSRNLPWALLQKIYKFSIFKPLNFTSGLSRKMTLWMDGQMNLTVLDFFSLFRQLASSSRLISNFRFRLYDCVCQVVWISAISSCACCQLCFWTCWDYHKNWFVIERSTKSSTRNSLSLSSDNRKVSAKLATTSRKIQRRDHPMLRSQIRTAWRWATWTNWQFITWQRDSTANDERENLINCISPHKK